MWRTAGAGAPLSHPLWPWGPRGAGQTARSSHSHGCSSGKGPGSFSGCSRGFRAKAAPTWLHPQRRHPQRSASGIWDGFYFIYFSISFNVFCSEPARLTNVIFKSGLTFLPFPQWSNWDQIYHLKQIKTQEYHMKQRFCRHWTSGNIEQ